MLDNRSGLWGVSGHTQVDPAWLTLKFWMGKVHQAGFDAVVALARGRDVVRLRCLNHSHMGTGLRAVSSDPLGLEIAGAPFMITTGPVLYK